MDCECFCAETKIFRRVRAKEVSGGLESSATLLENRRGQKSFPPRAECGIGGLDDVPPSCWVERLGFFPVALQNKTKAIRARVRTSMCYGLRYSYA